MSKRNERGAKRSCQNEECGAAFYDLNREEFACPVCSTAYDHEAQARALAEKRDAVPDHIRRRRSRPLPIVVSEETAGQGANDNVVPDDDTAGDGEEVAADETATAEAANVLLDEDEDTSDPLTEAVPLSVADDAEQ